MMFFILSLDKLSDQKQLRGGVYIVNSLPTTSFGKLKRNEALKLATDLYNERHHLSR